MGADEAGPSETALTHFPPEVVDVDRLRTWMDGAGLGAGPIDDVTALAGGTQNVLLRFRRGDDRYVLRRGPVHKRANSDETLRREARVLAALNGSDVPHPRLLGAHGELDVIGAAFTITEVVDGFNPSTGLPEPHASDLAMQHAMGLSMADAIAALGNVDHVAVGLADLGRADGWLERQVERWRSHLASYAAVAGYPGQRIPGVEQVAAWLDAHRPGSWSPGLIHGDFHFANVMIRHDAGAVAAMVDWELATIGDPLLDLGHLLATWPEPGAAAGVGFAAPGLPTRAEVIARYAAQSPRAAVEHARWYQVLACYRLGIILEGTHARAFAGQAPVEIGDRLHATTVGLFEQALGIIA